MSDGRGEGGLREAWRSRSWRALVASYGISGVGDWLYFTAFSVWLFERTGSPAWLGAAVVLRLLPYVLLGTLGGIIAERAPRRALLVGLDTARAALMVVLAVIVSADGEPALAVAVTVLVNLLTVPQRPAIASSTPDVVPERALAAANGAEAVVDQLSVFVGPAVAAALLAAGSPSTAIAANAATFALSALLVTYIPNRPLPGVGPDGGEAAAEAVPGGSGWTVIRATPGLGVLVAFVSVSVFVFGAEGILHVLVAEERLGRGAQFVGVLTAAIGIGGLLASPFATRVARSAQPGRWLIASAVMTGGPMVALAFVSSPYLAVAILFVEGVGLITFEVLAITLTQRLAGPALARVFGVQDATTAATQLTGAVLAPVLVGVLSLEAALVIVGSVLLVFTAVTAPALLRCGQRSAEEVAALRPLADELAALGLFDGASRSAVEAVAAGAVPVRCAAGEVVLAEGDPADDLYVIRVGTFAASAEATGLLRRMGPGDWFGEIGVLQRRPRTATVVADTDGELLRIPGPDLLAALEGLPVLPDPVRRTVSVRLAASSPAR